jgi:hypothetical protein
MTKTATVVANARIQLYALIFLLLGVGVGAVFGFKVGEATDPTRTAEAFNWLHFEIGVCSGLVACAVLVAASFRFANTSSD